MKVFIGIIVGLFVAGSQTVAQRAEFFTNPEKAVDSRDLGTAEIGFANGVEQVAASSCSADSLVIIYYGLNESHSRSWVQENANGVIGISYFQHFEGSYSEGTLLYKTIQPDGTSTLDSVTTGIHLEKSLLLFDSLSSPHIFVARSSTTNQVVDHYFVTETEEWQCDTIIQFFNEGGRFIYELSGDTGPDYCFHLLILKTRSDIDSDDYWDAWIGANLYHLTNSTGSWRKEQICSYDMPYTYDHQIKSSSRQDIQVDKDGYVHIIFGEQINGNEYPDPSRLQYANNMSGVWLTETALNPDSDTRDEAGWMASLCLDTNGIPHISCMYKKRYSAGSAVYCRLLLLKRLSRHFWSSEIVAAYDDGYYASDGRTYTGALSHLVFDRNNRPHVIFSDVASAHWGIGGTNRLSIGNIRYGVFDNGAWDIRTIYRQPLPTSFYNAMEMHGMCLVVSDLTDSIRVIGEELEITAAFQYTSNLLDFSLARIPTDVEEETTSSLPERFHLNQNFPNPFNPATNIEYSVPTRSHVTIEVYNILGQKIRILTDESNPAGDHQITWDGNDSRGAEVSTGVYFYRFQAGDFAETKKMILLR